MMNEIRMVQARRVRALPDYKLEVVFDDGMMGVIDLSEFVATGEITAPLRDPDFFSRVFVEMGVPTWPNGCDVDAIHLHMQMREAGTLQPASEAV